MLIKLIKTCHKRTTIHSEEAQSTAARRIELKTYLKTTFNNQMSMLLKRDKYSVTKTKLTQVL